MSAKQKWLDAGDKVDLARAKWAESLQMSVPGHLSDKAWAEYREARELEYKAFSEYQATLS